MVARFLNPHGDELHVPSLKSLNYAFNTALADAAAESCRKTAAAAGRVVQRSDDSEIGDTIPEDTV